MTAIEAATAIFGGLGLFFIAIRELSAALRRLAGPGLRKLMAHAAGGPVRSALTGFGIGLVTQSSSAATFVTTSLLSAGAISSRSAFTAAAWSNVGPAALVLIATVDLRLGALWLIGAIGFASVLGVGTRPKVKPLADAGLAIAVALLGLSIVKSATVILKSADPAAFAAVLPHDAVLLPFIAATVIAFVVQSSSTPTILSIKLAEVDLLSFDQLSMTVYGASLGSGLALLLAGKSLHGTARQVIYFQALFKAACAVLFVLLWEIETHGHVPLAAKVALWVGHDTAGGVAALFLMVQVVGCLALAPLWPAFTRLVARLAPPSAAEGLGKPEYIYPEAVLDSATALDLVAREIERLQGRLANILDAARDDVAAGGPDHGALMEGGQLLETEIGAFLADVLARECPAGDVARAVQLEARLDHARSLRETVGSLVDILLAVREDPVRAIVRPLAESLHFLLVQLAERQGEADDQLLQELTGDRGEMMEALRRQVADGGTAPAYAGQDQVFRATMLFERAVWLVRRMVLVAPSEGEDTRQQQAAWQGRGNSLNDALRTRSSAG